MAMSDLDFHEILACDNLLYCLGLMLELCAMVLALLALLVFYWYQSANTDAEGAGAGLAALYTAQPLSALQDSDEHHRRGAPDVRPGVLLCVYFLHEHASGGVDV